MQYPEPREYGSFYGKPHTEWSERDYDDLRVWHADLSAYWSWLSKRRFHALPEEKGIPVPYTGGRRKFKYVNGSGVSANSRILSHHYAREGEKGKSLRREVRRKERAQWQAEAYEELHNGDNAYDVAEWWENTPVFPWNNDDYECEFCQGPCKL